jgi:soluble lytic murein transglycosylase-like protein
MACGLGYLVRTMRGLYLRPETTLPPKARLGRGALAGLALFGFLFAGSSIAVGEEAHLQKASASFVRPVGSHDAALLGIAFDELLDGKGEGILLAETDIDAYRALFTAQAKAEWAKADAALAKVEDRRLVGHVLAQRYLHPTAYRATYDELKAWLARYGDQPEATRIHSLALRRQPRGENSPATPVASQGLQGGLRAAAAMASTDSPMWRAGLTAWQARDYQQALIQFQQLARSNDASPWDQAAGAFWTARCLARLHRPAEVSQWLSRAAAHPRTFYGLIAIRQLGEEASLNWAMPDLTGDHLAALAEIPAGKRAIALLQLGQADLAEAELRRIQPKGHDKVEEALVALAGMADMPNLALRVGTAVSAPGGALYDAAIYPLPRWQPEGGFEVDRALIYALVRQESRFEPSARSRAGATGLMQLMPVTASFVSGRSFTSDNASQLHDPQLNLTLGQQYVSHLLERPEVDGNLFYMLAAYNSGPTQVARWKRGMGLTNDPLLFLESLPASETRDFAERVLANYWIYQLQLDKNTPSLDAVAAGNWPLYSPDEDNVLQAADASPATLH